MCTIVYTLIVHGHIDLGIFFLFILLDLALFALAVAIWYYTIVKPDVESHHYSGPVLGYEPNPDNYYDPSDYNQMRIYVQDGDFYAWIYKEFGFTKMDYADLGLYQQEDLRQQYEDYCNRII